VCFQEFLEEARRAGVEVDKNKEEFVTRALTHEVRVTAIDVKNTRQIYEKLYGTSRTSIGPLQQAILKILTERENRKACKACSCLAKLQSLCKTHYNQIISVKNRRSRMRKKHAKSTGALQEYRAEKATFRSRNARESVKAQENGIKIQEAKSEIKKIQSSLDCINREIQSIEKSWEYHNNPALDVEKVYMSFVPPYLDNKDLHSLHQVMFQSNPCFSAIANRKRAHREAEAEKRIEEEKKRREEEEVRANVEYDIDGIVMSNEDNSQLYVKFTGVGVVEGQWTPRAELERSARETLVAYEQQIPRDQLQQQIQFKDQQIQQLRHILQQLQHKDQQIQ